MSTTSDAEVQRLFDLLEELIDAIEEEDIHRRKRKLETVRTKVQRLSPSRFKTTA
ncbi:MAG TPA: hypothetical protein VFR03_19460 [Thermoanaerobaculia bacterium]|nr:hypothetical protein [Thermoanaerobaculia bacterium]